MVDLARAARGGGGGLVVNRSVRGVQISWFIALLTILHDCMLRWLDSLNHGTLYFFRHRIFHSAHVKLSLGHCIALPVALIIGKVLSSYRSYVQRYCCHG